MRSLILISFIFYSVAYGQDSTRIHVDSLPIQELVSIDIMRPMISIRMETLRYSVISKKEIEEMQANDVGEILQKLEGVNLKSYGGLGGLKTISVRSLGSQHSAITVDGFSVQNSQTGQVNLAQLQTNNLESIALGVGEQAGYLIPVSSQIAGNNVLLETFEMSFPNYSDSLQIRSSAKIGSYGHLNGYGAVKVKIKKGFVSGFGNYRISNGLYRYKIENGTSSETLIRGNNDYEDQYYGGVAGYEFKNNTRLRVNYKQSKIDQGLPGAVIFYTNSADERLTSSDQSLSSDVRFRIGEGLYARGYINGNANEMRYFDPTYFNSVGKIDVTYLNRNLTGGLVASGHRVKDNYHIYDQQYFFGIEGGLSDLRSSDSLFTAPFRQQFSGIVGGRVKMGPLQLRAHVSGQLVHEGNQSGEAGKDVIGVNPYLSLETKELRPMQARHRLWYRNSLRVPSFNELYYNNIGNTNLVPEKANQFGYNLSFFPIDGNRKRVALTGAAFFNKITDKIVAIPTQNLFVWSIQNIGIVHAYGGEAGANIKWTYGGYSNPIVLNSSINYSYQRSINKTDSNHPSYGHQIAYIPIHTGNADLSLTYKQFGGKVSNYIVSKRYSLNENVESNEIGGFAITDFSLFYLLKLDSKQSIRFQAQLKNAFNKSYSYIRSFVMPGRNYLISINYAFN